MYLLLTFVYLWIEWHMPPLITFSAINNMLISVKRANFTLIFFKATCHANPVAEKKFVESNSNFMAHIAKI